MKFSTARRKASAAFTLVEVALALGVAGFCLVTVVGLVPLGVSTSQLASDQTVASSILTHVLADLRATPMTSPPGGATTSTEYSVAIPPDAARGAATPVVRYFGSSGQQFTFPTPQPVASPPVGSRYRLTLNFLTQPGVPPAGARTATWVTMLVSWPPQVDPNKPATGTPTGRVQIFAALDRN